MIRAGARGYSPPEMARGGGSCHSRERERDARAIAAAIGTQQRERERERGDSASGGREGEIETLARVCARRRRGCRRRRGSG